MLITPPDVTNINSISFSATLLIYSPFSTKPHLLSNLTPKGKILIRHGISCTMLINWLCEHNSPQSDKMLYPRLYKPIPFHQLCYTKFSKDQIGSNYGHIILIYLLPPWWQQSHNNHLGTAKIKHFAKKHQIKSRRYERTYETTFSETQIYNRLLGWGRNLEDPWNITVTMNLRQVLVWIHVSHKHRFNTKHEHHKSTNPSLYPQAHTFLICT
jgi:hypothetical protein